MRRIKSYNFKILNLIKLKMEILNNKASKIEENPPKYIEEWRGSKPCKWLGGKKIIGRPNTSDDYYQSILL